jgi:membrane protein implicated in regulation of membrane protease activity
MLIAFIPVFILCVLLAIVGAPTWVQWIVPLVCLTIAGIIGFKVQLKMEQVEKEEAKRMQRNKKGKIVPKREDVDIFGE